MVVYEIIVLLLLFIFCISLFTIYDEWKEFKKRKLLKRINITLVKQLGSDKEKKFKLKGRFKLDELESLIISAGVNISPENLLLICLCSGSLFFALCILIGINLFVSFFLVLLGSFLPIFYLRILRNRREQAVLDQLPEAIDMIVRALKAGQSVDNALRNVGNNFPPPFGQEIKLVYEEIAVGIPFDNALRNLEQRFSRLADIKMFCTAFIIQREAGGNLSDILENLSNALRQRIELKMQVKALTAEGKASAVVIASIPLCFALITWLVNPGYITLLLTTPIGKKFLLTAVVLDGLGLYIMRKLTRVEI